MNKFTHTADNPTGMTEILFTTNNITNWGEQGKTTVKLKVELDRQDAFGIIEKLTKFVENIPMDSHKCTFLTFYGEAHVAGDTDPENAEVQRAKA